MLARGQQTGGCRESTGKSKSWAFVVSAERSLIGAVGRNETIALGNVMKTSL
jgi:hypothetical protein